MELDLSAPSATISLMRRAAPAGGRIPTRRRDASELERDALDAPKGEVQITVEPRRSSSIGEVDGEPRSSPSREALSGWREAQACLGETLRRWRRFCCGETRSGLDGRARPSTAG